VIVSAWLWAGLLMLFLLYSRSLLATSLAADPESLTELSELWYRPMLFGLSIRYAIKVVNVLFIILLWLRLRSSRWWRQRHRLGDKLLYLGTAALLLALEWACHLLGEAIPRWGEQPVYL
jgi:hypothetical protein